MNPKALIFLHIPKTAGTTLNRLIDCQYSPFEIFTIDPHRIKASSERLARSSEERRRRWRVVRGHLTYGIHECLPQGATYITLLREPVARVLSAYYFVARRPLNPLYRKVKSGRLRIEDCLRLFPERRNTQCRFIAGVKDTSIGDERLLELAKENLSKSFSVVGISERFEESLMLFATTFGWNVPVYRNCRVAKARPQIDPGVAEMIRDYNRLDVELYRFGTALFEEKLRAGDSAVQEKLAAFRALRPMSPIASFRSSTLQVGRFLLNKFASAV